LIAAREDPQRIWTIAELLRWTEDRFRKLGFPTPRLDAEILLASALGATRIRLYTEYQKLVEPEERARFRALVERRSKREPVAYIVGKREFYSLELEVGPAVLVPRPETEHLVEVALAELKARSAGGETGDEARLLDLGTGSGNIAIAIAVNAPGVRIDAVDSSRAALEVAARNARAHGVDERIRFHEGDFLAGVPAGALYDLVVSNPPYIPRREYESLMADVRLHEPREALIDTRSPAGDGLGFYRELAAGVRALARPGALVAVEVGAPASAGAPSPAAEVADLFTSAGIPHERTVRDLAGIDRVVTARVPLPAPAPSPGP
jgi:release factor glutamine methyltransferase